MHLARSPVLVGKASEVRVPTLSSRTLVTATACYLLALVLASEHETPWVWGAVGAWLVAVGGLLITLRNAARVRVTTADLMGEASVVAVCVLARSLFLDTYPFHIVGDAIRDDGLYPIAIATGRRTPFEWGPYQSMTLVLPAFIAVFYRMWGGVHFFQVCSIVVSAVEVALVYAVARRAYGRREAVIVGLVLATLPVHLAFARGETTIVLSSFWTTVLLALGVRYAEDDDRRWLVAFGVLAGVAANFHSSARSVVFLAAGWVCAREVWRAGRSASGTPAWRQATARVALWFAAALVGFGPSILIIERALFGMNRLAVDNGVAAIAAAYLQTLRAYVYAPLAGHVPPISPLVAPVMSIPLVAGACVALKRGRSVLSVLLLALLILIPLTNSAATDMPVAAYRLAPLFPVVALTIGASVQLFPTSRVWGATMIIIAVIGSAYHVGVFFSRAPLAAIEGGGMTREMAYAYAHAVRIARSEPNLAQSSTLCWGVGANHYGALHLMHYRENLEFYLPGRNHDIRERAGLPDSTIYLAPTCPEDWTRTAWTAITVCRTQAAYSCGGTGPFSIMVPQ